MAPVGDIPAAEWPIDEHLVRRLIGQQRPEWAELPIAELGHGWDNVLYRLGDDLLVRLPRRALAVPLIAHERDWLPVLAPRLNTFVPAAVHAGTPSADFPHPWLISPYRDGIRCADVGIAQRTPSATDLAETLVALHTTAPADAPVNPWRGGPIGGDVMSQRVATRLASYNRASEDLAARWAAWSAAPAWDGPPVWLHGDLHPLNLLLADSGRLAGVLDWGDVGCGDPATDLATAWLSYDQAGRRRFVAAASAGPYDPHVWTRARAWALYLALAFVTNSDDSPPLLAVAHQALDSLAAEPLEVGEPPRRRPNILSS